MHYICASIIAHRNYFDRPHPYSITLAYGIITTSHLHAPICGFGLLCICLPWVVRNKTTQMGMVNAMRTGNVVFDMAIAMSIPAVLQGLFKFWEWLRPRIEKFLGSLKRQEDHFFRSIDYEKVKTELLNVESILLL